MAEITGGELKYIATIDTSQLDKSLVTSEGRLKGFSEIAKATGTTLDNSIFKKRGPQELNIFGLTKENIKIQKQVIEDIKKQIDELRDKASNVAPGMAQASIIGEIGPLKAELAAEEQALIRLQTELGETEQKQISLTTARNQALDTMRRLALQNKQDTEEYKTAEQNVLKYGEAIEQTNTRAKMLAAGGLSGVINNLGVISSGLSSGVAIMALFNSENENLNRIMLKTQALLSISITLQQLYQTEMKGSGIMASVLAFQEMARARATDAATAATGRATIAQRLFNVVANANPYVLLATGIITVVGAIGIYMATMGKLAQKQQEQADLNKKIADSVAGPLIAYRQLQDQWNALGNDLKAKEKFINGNKDAFHDLGVEVNSVSDVEDILINKTNAVTRAMFLRAEASAKAEVAQEAYKKALQARMDYESEADTFKNGNLADRALIGLKRESRLESLIKTQNKNNAIFNKMMNESAADSNEAFKTLTSAGLTPWLGNPDKVKKERKSKTKEEKADEYFPPGSVAEIQKRLSEIDEALSKATGAQQIDALKQRRMQIALELAAAEKKVRIKTFDEEMSDTKKQIELRDKLIQQNFDKGKVDQIFPEVKDKTYLQYLEETAAALKNLILAGDNTEETAANLNKTREAIEQFKGYKSHIDLVAKSIDDLKSRYSGLELINKLEGFSRLNAGDTESERQATKNAVAAAIEAEQEVIRKAYDQALKDQETFDERRRAIQEKFRAFEAEERYQNASIEERERIKKAYDHEITEIELGEFKKSKAWALAFGNLKGISNSSLDFLIKKFEEFRDKYQETMSVDEFNTLSDVIGKLKDEGEEGSFKNVIKTSKEYFDSLQNLNKAKKLYKAGSEEVIAAEEKHQLALQNSDRAFSKLEKNLVGFLQNASSISKSMGSSGEGIAEFIAGVTSIVQSVSAVRTGIQEMGKKGGDIWSAFNNVSGIISAIIAIVITAIKLIASLFNKDKKREKEIKAWKAAVDALKISYEALNDEIERTAGEAQLTRQRELIANLQKQQKIIEDMRNTESQKKKSDSGKISDYNAQIAAINLQIQDMADNFKDSITTTNFKELSQKLADALIEAYGKGEDAALAYEKVVQDVMRNAVANALKIKFIQPLADEFIDKFYAAMGFGNASAENAIEDKIDALEQQLANAPTTNNPAINAAIRKALEDQIAKLKAQLAELQMSGAFDGLTQEEIDLLTGDFQNDPRFQAYLDGIKSLDELFNGAFGQQAQGLKGDIKGITEKTAGALEAQMNAIRMYQVEAVNIHKKNADVLVESLQNLVMIEYNTRHLIRIDKNIEEMNSKMKKGLAGVP